MPYAAPPVGADRWREAQPPRPHPPLDAATLHLQHLAIDLVPGARSELRRSPCDTWDQIGD